MGINWWIIELDMIEALRQRSGAEDKYVTEHVRTSVINLLSVVTDWHPVCVLNGDRGLGLEDFMRSLPELSFVLDCIKLNVGYAKDLLLASSMSTFRVGRRLCNLWERALCLQKAAWSVKAKLPPSLCPGKWPGQTWWLLRVLFPSLLWWWAVCPWILYLYSNDLLSDSFMFKALICLCYSWCDTTQRLVRLAMLHSGGSASSSGAWVCTCLCSWHSLRY